MAIWSCKAIGNYRIDTIVFSDAGFLNQAVRVKEILADRPWRLLAAPRPT
jgi:hypothetical protein